MKTLKQLNRLKNTRIVSWDDDNRGCCYLHGSRIVSWDNFCIWISLCTYNTVTTRRRINQILEILDLRVRVFTKKGEPYMYVNGHTYDINSRSLYRYEKSTGAFCMMIDGCAVPMVEQP